MKKTAVLVKAKEMKIVGDSVPRVDGIDKATGAPFFTSDIELPGMLYGKVLRSPYPHARVVNVDTSKAEQLPGVKAVIWHKNTSKVKFNGAATSILTLPPAKPVLDQNVFSPVVRYVGDEVAAVAAETEEIAEKALKLLEVEYEELPYVLDYMESMKPETPVIHEGCEEGKNIPGEKIHLKLGDIEKGFAEADRIFEHTFKLSVVKQCNMETHSAVASFNPDGSLVVYSTTQAHHPCRRMLATIFDIPYSKVRVLGTYTGGGFGVRIGLSAKAEPLATALAKEAKRPVKVVYDRTEDFIASDTRHGGHIYMKTGVKKDGTLVAREVRSILNTGAYSSWGVEAPAVLGCMGMSMYRCPHQLYVGHSVYTNTTTAGAMRGFGSPQALTAVETHLDAIAEEMGFDRLEFRKKNLMKPGDEWVLPYPCHSNALGECIDKGAEAIGWDKRGTFDNTGTVKRGLGMGCGTHVSNAWPFCGDYSNAYVTIQEDGSVQVASGVPEMGTGLGTVLAQMAAETLGVDFDMVKVIMGDTESTPFEIGSHASRACYAAGAAVTEASQEAKKFALEFAAELFSEGGSKVDAEDLDIVDNTVVSTSDPSKKMPLGEVCDTAHIKGIQFIGIGKVIPNNTPPWMAHFADVSIDTETGKVTVNKLVGAHDVGRAINPIIVEGQVEGGLAQGLGYALSEEILYDDKGRQLNNSYHSYMLPTAVDMPEFVPIIVECDDPSHPYNVKGVGETGLIPTVAAIVNAIYDAIGIRFWEIPVTEEKVFMALNK